MQAHVDHQAVAAAGQAAPVDPRTLLIDLLMAGHKGDAGTSPPVGHRNAGVGRRRDARRHAGHHLHRDAPGRQMGRLLAAPAKQKGIAALEPHDQTAAAGQLHQHRIGTGLGHRMVAAALAHEAALTARRHQIQQGLGHQGVVDEGIALLQEAMGLEGEQLGIARTRPHQIHGAGLGDSAGLGGGTHGRASRDAMRN